jgi:hypothetical protein
MSVTLQPESSLNEPGIASARWYERPLTGLQPVLAWLLATVVFIFIAMLLGGPTQGDMAESAYSTWVIAHGHLACVYPPNQVFKISQMANPFALVAPLYPLLSGGLYDLLRIGHAAPAFPSVASFGASCQHSISSMFNWSTHAGVVTRTADLGYLVWPVLLWGFVAFLRTTKRARTMTEAAGVLMLAVTAPVVMTLVQYFHPQDALAMGLVLVSLAYSRRSKWVLAGIFIGLAFTAQQFAVLVAAPLFVLAPAGIVWSRPQESQRLRLVFGAVIATAVVDLPIALTSSTQALKAIAMGSSRVGSNIRSRGGTVLWEVNLHGALLFLVSRLLPIAAAAGIAWLAKRRLGEAVMEPEHLIGVVTLALAMRMIFEVNQFGYYYMAIAVSLLLLDLTRGKIRGQTLSWLAFVTVAFNPVHWGLFSNWTAWEEPLYFAVPDVILAIAIVSVIYDAFHHKWMLYKFAFIGWTMLAVWWLFPLHHAVLNVPGWLWQVILVPQAIKLAKPAIRRPLSPEAESLVREKI